MSAVADKIGLFRSLFRGREEVYARRFTSGKTGKSGYQPVGSLYSVGFPSAYTQKVATQYPILLPKPVLDGIFSNIWAGG